MGSPGDFGGVSGFTFCRDILWRGADPSIRLLLFIYSGSIPERLSVVYAVLDCIYYRSVLCVPALSQYMEAGKYFRIADEYCRLRSIIAGIWHRHYVYASADA